jgi:hypothetical protein
VLQKKKATTTLLSLPSVLRCSNTKRRQRQHALTFFAKLHPHNKKKGMTGSYRLPCYAATTEQEEGDDRVPSLFSLRYNKKKKKVHGWQQSCRHLLHCPTNQKKEGYFCFLGDITRKKTKKATTTFTPLQQKKRRQKREKGNGNTIAVTFFVPLQ